MDDSFTSKPALESRQRWRALMVLQLGLAMIVVDGTIVNVALAAIKADLRVSDSSLVWIGNAYLLTFASFLLVAGRVGDIYGQRRVFLLGTTIFTVASLGCGLAQSEGVLIGARALQGLGAAIVSAISLSLTMKLFPERVERARALAVRGIIVTGCGSVGLLLGGTLTSAFNWHWIFVVNLPIGMAVYALSVGLIPGDSDLPQSSSLDVGGALTATSSLMLVVYALVKSNKVGWACGKTIASLAGAAFLMIIFVYIESRVRAPLVPLGLFRDRNFRIASIALSLVSVSLGAWYFFVTLYLQLVLGYSPLGVGLAFLPANLMMMVFSLGVSTRLIVGSGTKAPLALGLLLTVLGLLLFARAPVEGKLVSDVLPGMFLLGLGGTIAVSSLTIAAMIQVAPTESGLVSGIVNSTLTIGGAVGLAVLANIAEARTRELLAAGSVLPIALTAGYHEALLFSAGIVVATSVCVALLRS